MIVSVMESKDGKEWLVLVKDKLITVKNPIEAIQHLKLNCEGNLTISWCAMTEKGSKMVNAIQSSGYVIPGGKDDLM